ncbi:hypothetical protein K0M31_012512 [Melipona bicolor]|uniref:Uncharacterized protein n=1 Tax=Melipona bicolor TaxID=60889 RepID=A0AA40KHJ1_9HYME|nr:hypothetical protein K0M31_012512 [Melipona bicolor]
MSRLRTISETILALERRVKSWLWARYGPGRSSYALPQQRQTTPAFGQWDNLKNTYVDPSQEIDQDRKERARKPEARRLITLEKQFSSARGAIKPSACHVDRRLSAICTISQSAGRSEVDRPPTVRRETPDK